MSIKDNIKFGSGSFVGEAMQDSEFFELDTRSQARVLGWAAGCPVVSELTDPDTLESGRGPEAMVMRYGEVSFWFGYINREAAKINQGLSEQLVNPVGRLKDEPVGIYEEESVPLSHRWQMSGLSTLAGYALPRIFIEQLGTHQKLGSDQVQERLVRGIFILKENLRIADSPLELLSMLGEDLVTAGHAQSKDILKHMLSAGWLAEHGAQSVIDELKVTMHDISPTLWRFYDSLSTDERQELELA